MKRILIYSLLILPLLIFSGCKNNKENSVKSPEENIELSDIDYYEASENNYSINDKEDTDFNDKLTQEQLLKKILNGEMDPNGRIKSGPLTLSSDENPYFLYGETTPLTQSRKPEITELLIKYGARVNDQDEYGRTALMVSSVFDGYDENDNLNAKMLIKNGADINVKDNKGQTALYIAIVGKNTASIKLLVDKGADVNLRDNRGLSPLMLANIVYRDGWYAETLEKITKILVKAGALMNDADKHELERIIDEDRGLYELYMSINNTLNMSGGDDCR